MGAEAYFYVVKYQPDIQAALQELRQREFKAGRYNPVTPFPRFPVDPATPGPGAEHASIEEATSAAEADGTRSILDLYAVSATPYFGRVVPLPEARLNELFGTATPARSMIEANPGFFDEIRRGQGIYIILYKNNEPDEILFAGYSYD